MHLSGSERGGGGRLDVQEIEPAATERELKDAIGNLPGAYGTHHVGASTEQAQIAVAAEVVRVIDTFVQTGRRLHCVNTVRPEQALR